MASKEKIIEDRDWVTEQLSSRMWTVSTAVLATAVALALESPAAKVQKLVPTAHLVWPILFSLASMMFDLLQYVVATKQISKLLNEIEIEGVKEKGYRTSDLLYRCRSWFFSAKIILSLLSVFALTLLLVRAVFKEF